jgi:hypothetical protein
MHPRSLVPVAHRRLDAPDRMRDDETVIRMFLTPTAPVPGSTGRREKSDHPTVEAAKRSYAENPERVSFEALIYVDGEPAWVGAAREEGDVSWQAWKV